MGKEKEGETVVVQEEATPRRLEDLSKQGGGLQSGVQSKPKPKMEGRKEMYPMRMSKRNQEKEEDEAGAPGFVRRST